MFLVLLTSSGSAFCIFGPTAMRHLRSHFSVLQLFTSKSKGQTLQFVLDVKIDFMKLGFSSVTVLNIQLLASLFF